MIIVFVACIGLVQLFISMDIAKFSAKKIILITLSLGLLLAVVNYAVIELVMPETMIHKKYALSAGALVFAFFALVVSLLMRNRKKTGLFLSIFSCILYGALLVTGEKFSVKHGINGIINIWIPNMVFLYLTIGFYLVHKLFELHKRNSSNNTTSGETVPTEARQ